MKRYLLANLAPLALPLALVVSGCAGGDDDASGQPAVKSTADAKRAYLGLDASIDKAIALGFDGFNAATNANIAPQSADGEHVGTMTVSGQVDQGASANKTMHLSEALEGYSDDAHLIYDTNPASLPAIEMKLSKVPTGTLDGTLSGSFTMRGDLEGSVTLELAFSGELQPTAADATKVERKPGTTHITGTATSGNDSYAVDVTR
ncbi:MAG TPA: hypothetical protein VFV94_04150 [Polyangiaceae bacterium]|nr:hypothetical protein [Polyangiaceae bacterium]